MEHNTTTISLHLALFYAACSVSFNSLNSALFAAVCCSNDYACYITTSTTKSNMRIVNGVEVY